MLAMSADLGSDRTSERARVVRASLRPFGDVPEVREVLDSA